MEGIITGIGDKQQKLNLISPQLDAEVYKYIINRNGIVTGLEIVENVLTRGICIAEGYRGELTKNVSLKMETISETKNAAVITALNPLPDGPIYNATKIICLPEGEIVTSATARVTLGTSLYIHNVTYDKNIVTVIVGSPAGEAGEIEVDITYKQGGNYIYGKFVLNHDNDKPDRFSVILTSAPLEYKNDDILHVPGTFYLPLYENGVIVGNTIKYPKNCAHADYARVIKAGGSLGAGTTAVTQPVDDNSNKVATTEFVANQIKKDIDFKEVTVELTHSGSSAIGHFKFRKKAKMVTVEALGNTTALSFVHSGDYIPVPEGFSPPKNTQIVLAFNNIITAAGDGNVYGISYRIFHINANGDKAICIHEYQETNSSNKTSIEVFAKMGYELI